MSESQSNGGPPAGEHSSRIVSASQAERMVQDGYNAVDLHVHTLCSFDVLPADKVHPETLFRKARRMGMRWVTFTDHDTMDAYDIVGWEREGLVTGVEIKLLDEKRVGHTIHVNVFQLSRVQFQELEEIAQKDANLESFLAYLDESGLPYVYNHPFWFEPGEVGNWTVIPSLIRLFPVVEYNMHRVFRKNMLTVGLAQRYGKGMVASTDTHTGEIARAFTLARGETFEDFFANIRRGESYLVAQDLTVGYLTSEMINWLEMAFREGEGSACEEKRLRTGFDPLDRRLRELLSGGMRRRPFAYRVFQVMSFLLSRSRIPALLYVQSQHSLAREIDRQLRTAGVIV